MQWKIWSLENMKSRGVPIPNLKFSSMMTDTGLSHRNGLGEAEVRALKMDHQLKRWSERAEEALSPSQVCNSMGDRQGQHQRSQEGTCERYLPRT